MIKKIWNSIEEKLRVCLCVLIGGLLTFLVSSLLPSTWMFSIFLGFLGAITAIMGFGSLVIYWCNWAD